MSYDPAILLLGIYPKKMKTLAQKDTFAFMVTALFIQCSLQHRNSQDMETTQAFINR